MIRWMKSSPYSLRAVGRPYAVSRARVLDVRTGELVDRYSAWHGEPMEAPSPPDPFPREGKGEDRPGSQPGRVRGRLDIQMPELLGVFDRPGQAKACCEAHPRD